jgi:hypothetical protein
MIQKMSTMKGQYKSQLFSDYNHENNFYLHKNMSCLRSKQMMSVSKYFYFLHANPTLPFVDESYTKYQRILPLFNFKGTGGRAVSNIAQFRHERQIRMHRARLSVTVVSRQAGNGCLGAKGNLCNVDLYSWIV